MKKILFFLLLPFSLLSQNNKLDEKNGFGNFVFGTTSSAYKNLTLELDEAGTRLYSSPKNHVVMDGVDFDNINVTFIKDKLSSITLQTKNGSGDKLIQQLKNMYGAPSKSNPAKGIYEWVSSKVQLLCELRPGTKDATISVYSKTK